QGAGPGRGPRAVLHPRPRALHARAQEPGALLPATAARRGAPVRHRQPPDPAGDRHAPQPLGRDRGGRPRPQARPAARLRLGPRRVARLGRGPRQGGGRQPGSGPTNLRLLPQGLTSLPREAWEGLSWRPARFRRVEAHMQALPNLLTSMRLVLALFRVLALAAAAGGVPWRSERLEPESQFALQRWAFWAFVVAAVTDFFDGWLARKLNATSVWGAIL